MRSFSRRLFLQWFVPPVALGGMAGCGSTGGGRRGEAVDGTLTIVAPPGDDWETIDTETGRYFVMAIDGMADVVAFFAVTSRPGDKGITSLEQLDQVLQLTANERYPKRTTESIFGHPVLRYESLRRDSMDGSAVFREKLNLRPRPSGYQYAVREKGIFVLHPFQPGYIVRVGCARTSYHGLLGSHYNTVNQSFLESFVAENMTGGGGGASATY